MNEVFLARQPIFDGQLRVVGYELLFRAGHTTTAVIPDPEGATARVVLNSVTELDLERVVGTQPAWINVSREFLLRGYAQSVPPGLVLLEILEGQLIDDELVAAVGALKERGHRLALDDFEYAPEAEPLLALVDVVKLDLQALGPQRLQREVDRLRAYGVTILAEKVETREEFTLCTRAGCDLFQGYFFCRPELVRGRSVDASRMSLLQLLAALQDPATELSELERIMALDLGLSYRLLRYINSAFFGLRQEVRSIRQALALLGLEKLRPWAALTIFASIDDKPAELTRTALTRARFCELADASVADATSSELFTLGLFSVIDALTDLPMGDVVTRIPFPEETRQALVTHSGSKGRLLDCVAALEAGEADRAHAIVPNAAELHLEAIGWANEAAEAVFAPVAVAA